MSFQHFFSQKNSLPSRASLEGIMRGALLSVSLLVILFSAKYVVQEHMQVLPEKTAYRSLDLSGLTKAKARQKLVQYIENRQVETLHVEVLKDGQFYKDHYLTAGQHSIFLDTDKVINAVFLEKRNNFTASALGKTKAEVSSSAYTQEDISSLLRIAQQSESDPESAHVFLNDEKEWQLVSHRNGWQLQTTESELKTQLDRLDLQEEAQKTVVLQLESVKPEVLTEGLEQLYSELQYRLNKTLRWGNNTDIPALEVGKHPQFFQLKNRALVLDLKAIKTWIDEFSENYSVNAGIVNISSAQQQEKGYLKSRYEGEFLQGRDLDKHKMYNLLVEFLESSEQELVVEIPWVYREPQVSMEGYGQLTLVSEGLSSFTESNDENRAFNVGFGLEKYNGVVIPQGEEFSFNQILGWVTYDAGWKPAAAIFGGGGVRKVPGGGLCQVSTTIYRAALLAGLELTQRKPHSLDVQYYRAHGYGLDSTIFPPADIDLKFKNNTPGPLFIYTYLKEDLKEVVVHFYGVDDQRVITLTPKKNTIVPAPIHKDYSADVEPGRQKIVRNGRTGRYIEWERTVSWPNGDSFNELISTLYPPSARHLLLGQE